MSLSYKDAGVDVEAGYKAVSLMKKHVESTFSQGVLSGIGGFGGLFSIKEAKEMEEPVLCSGTDGVGTKLKLAFLMDKHDTIGIDCVAMCVNDIICMGAKPLFFLDYIACGKNVPEKIAQIVKGISQGCIMGECSLIGGETAEMPGFYPEDEYDLAGFCVGIVDRNKIIDGTTIVPGDAIIGISSSGIHSNGYSLVRSVLRPNQERVQEFIKSLDATMGDTLLTPTKIYVKPILKMIQDVSVKGIVNITGGGFYENIPRILPEGTGAEIKTANWEMPPLFRLLQETGNVSDEDMFGTFNMGIGMAVVASQENAQAVIASLKESGEEAAVIGKVTTGSGVQICFK